MIPAEAQEASNMFLPYILGGGATAVVGVIGGYILARITKKEPINLKDKLELAKLEQAEVERQHARTKELATLNHQHRMETASKLLETLKPSISAYNEQLRMYQDALRTVNPELERSRQEYRDELVKSFKKSGEEDSDLGIYGSDFIVNEDDEAKIISLVNMRYPRTSMPMPEMPKELGKLINLLTEKETGEE